MSFSQEAEGDYVSTDEGLQARWEAGQQSKANANRCEAGRM